MKTYKNISEIDKDAMQAFLNHAKKEWDMESNEFKKLDDIVAAICDQWNTKESMDSDYLYRTYSLKVGDYKFEIVGSSYRKDGGVCDEEMDDFITITNLKKEKIKKSGDNKKKWDAFFKGKNPASILEELKNYKFPTKIK